MKKYIKYIILTVTIIGACGFINESHAIFDKLKKAAGFKCTDSDCGASITPNAVFQKCLPDDKTAKKNSSCAVSFWAAKCQDINSVHDSNTIKACYIVDLALGLPRCNIKTAEGSSLDKNALRYCFDAKLLAQAKSKTANQHVIDFYVAFWHHGENCKSKKSKYNSQCMLIKKAIPDIEKRRIVTPSAPPKKTAPAQKAAAPITQEPVEAPAEETAPASTEEASPAEAPTETPAEEAQAE